MTADAALGVAGTPSAGENPASGSLRRVAENAAGEVDDLLAACGAGDRQAFAALYGAAAPRLFALALRMLKRRDLAEEALQDCFIEIWRQAARYDRERGAAVPRRSRELPRLRSRDLTL